MTRDEIKSELTEIFHEVFSDESLMLRDSMTAEDVADWDSQTHINLILAAEMQFRVRFRTSELEALKNVGDFVSTIEAKVNGPGHGS